MPNIITIALTEKTLSWFDALTGVNLIGDKRSQSLDTDGKNLSGIIAGIRNHYITLVDGTLSIGDSNEDEFTAGFQTKFYELWSLVYEVNISKGTWNFLYISNPLSSNKNITLLKVIFYSMGDDVIWRFYKNPTGTITGTTINPQNQYIGGANTPSSVLNNGNILGAPSNVSNRGTQFLSLSSAKNVLYSQDLNMLLAPGSKILVSINKTNTNIVGFNLIWAETI